MYWHCILDHTVQPMDSEECLVIYSIYCTPYFAYSKIVCIKLICNRSQIKEKAGFLK